MKISEKSKIRQRTILVCLFACVFVGAASVSAQTASGGNYTLTQSAIANGGASGTSASGNFAVEGTTGQSAAGTRQQNSPFTFQPGFWTAVPLTPTAAAVTVSGRVTASNKRGIRNVQITLLAPDGTTRRALSGAFGVYLFADVPAGATYILTASAKRFVFSVPAQVVTLNEDRDDIDFVGENVFPQ